MSLPNPDSVVTEERLSEFYAGIRPYLGGMPDVLANKFNKSDLYSTNEQLIGRWIDGKPLYQKVIEANDITPGNTVTIAHGISNLDSVCDIRVIWKTASTKYRYNATFRPSWYTTIDGASYMIKTVTDTDIQMIVGSDFASGNVTSAKIVIQYTKTSDAAIYVGSDTDYSTDEKIVGTWIDGKPIYQKTWELTSAVNIGTDWTDITSIIIPNVKRVIESEGSGPDALAYSFPIIGAHDGAFFQCCTSRTNDNAVKYITVRYTKTTD